MERLVTCEVEKEHKEEKDREACKASWLYECIRMYSPSCARIEKMIECCHGEIGRGCDGTTFAGRRLMTFKEQFREQCVPTPTPNCSETALEDCRKTKEEKGSGVSCERYEENLTCGKNKVEGECRREGTTAGEELIALETQHW